MLKRLIKLMREIGGILYKENDILKRNIRKEFVYLFSLSFKKYLKNLFFPENKKFIFLFFSYITFFPIFKLFFDVIVFILTVIFNFYYIFMERIFEFLKKLNEFFFLNSFVFGSNLRVILKLRDFFLFMYFFRIRREMEARRVRLYTLLIERFMDKIVRILRTRIKFRKLLRPFIWLVEFVCVFFFFWLSFIVFILDLIIRPILIFLYYVIYLNTRFFLKYYLILFNFKSKGPLYVSDVVMLQMSTMLQKNGFVAPVCKNKLSLFKAKLAYRQYRKLYISSELEPDVLDRAALDIYIYLKEDLFKGTRYQRKFIGVFELLKVLFPFNIIIFLFQRLTYFYMGLWVLFYIFFTPFWILLYIGIGIGLFLICFIYIIMLLRSSDDYLIIREWERKYKKYKKDLYFETTYYMMYYFALIIVCKDFYKLIKIFFKEIKEDIDKIRENIRKVRENIRKIRKDIRKMYEKIKKSIIETIKKIREKIFW